MSIKSSNNQSFYLKSFRYYNWGETVPTTNTVIGYRHGIQVANMTYQAFNTDYLPQTVHLPTGFDNVDEVRLFISGGGYLGNQTFSHHTLNDIVIAPFITLPVALTNFSAKTKEGNATLEWQTTRESNASHFEVERSLNGYDFLTIARISAKGESTTIQSYQFADVEAGILNKELAYYRLKMIDSDHSFSYSSIESICFSNLSQIDNMIAFPNPISSTSKEVTIRFNGLTTGTHTLQILNQLGQLQLEETIILKGEKESKINLTGLQPGMYFLKVKGLNRNYTQPLLIQ